MGGLSEACVRSNTADPGDAVHAVHAMRRLN